MAERMERNGQRMIAKDHFYYHPAPNELAGIFFHYIFVRIGPFSCKLDSYHCNCITPSSSWGRRGMTERMERNGQKMIAKDHFYYHPSPNELAGIFFHYYFREDISICLANWTHTITLTPSPLHRGERESWLKEWREMVRK